MVVKMIMEIKAKTLLNKTVDGSIVHLGSVGNPNAEITIDKLMKKIRPDIIGVDIQDGADIKTDLEKRFPFKNERFNNAIASEIIEHVKNPLHFLNECYRILKPKGRLILTTPNAVGTYELRLDHNDRWKEATTDLHYFSFKLSHLKFMLKRTKFKVLEAKYTAWLEYDENETGDIYRKLILPILGNHAPSILMVLEK